MCLCAETQEGPAPVTDDAAGEEADPRRGGIAGTLSSGAAGSSAGKTTPDSLSICCHDHDPPTTTTVTTTITPLLPPTILFTTIITSPSQLAFPCLHHDLLAPKHVTGHPSTWQLSLSYASVSCIKLSVCDGYGALFGHCDRVCSCASSIGQLFAYPSSMS